MFKVVGAQQTCIFLSASAHSGMPMTRLTACGVGEEGGIADLILVSLIILWYVNDSVDCKWVGEGSGVADITLASMVTLVCHCPG